MGRWQRYWFGDGGRTSVALLRIAIATSALLTLARLDNPVSTSSATLYRPVGLWMLTGHHAPPHALVQLLWLLAWTSTAAMLVGLVSRASAAVSCVTTIALASLSYSASPTWSHAYNVVLLAQLAFLGARGGDMLSVDALLRHRRRLPPLYVRGAYQWSIRLVQLAVALMFAGACFHKILHGHFTLRWALSDSLRNHLLVAYDLADLPRPTVANWLIDDPWRYRTAAVLNLISQAMPLAAVFLMKRPLLRAFAGSFFVLETIGLALVVNLWNPHWLPLAAVFVDWDRLFGHVTPPAVDDAPHRPSRRLRIWIVAFLIYDVFTAFVPGVDQRLNTFPFSGFPMFATVRARPPYDQHLPYSVAAPSFEVTADRMPLDISIQRWFDHANRSIMSVRDPVEAERRLRAVLANAQRRWPAWGIRSARLWLAMFESPAVPAPAHFELHRIAVIGEVTADGAFHTHLGPLSALPAGPLTYYADDMPDPHPTTAPIDPKLAGNPLYFVIEDQGLPWLAAMRSTWRWQ